MTKKESKENATKDYYEKGDEFNTRLQRMDSLEEKLVVGKKLEQEYREYFKERYPLFLVGEERLVNFLRENEDNIQSSQKGEFYNAIVKDGNIIINEDQEISQPITRTEINDAIAVNTVLSKIRHKIEWVEDQLKIDELLAPVNFLISDEEKINWLTEMEFSNENKKLRCHQGLKFEIRKKIEAIREQSTKGSEDEGGELKDSKRKGYSHIYLPGLISLQEQGFFELEKVKQLSYTAKIEVLGLLLTKGEGNTNLPKKIMLLDSLSFLDKLLTRARGQREHFYEIVAKIIDENKTNVRLNINSLAKPKSGYNPRKYQEEIIQLLSI